MINVGIINETEAERLQGTLQGIAGVGEAVVVADEGVAYLKVDTQYVDFTILDEFSRAET